MHVRSRLRLARIPWSPAVWAAAEDQGRGDPRSNRAPASGIVTIYIIPGLEAALISVRNTIAFCISRFRLTTLSLSFSFSP